MHWRGWSKRQAKRLQAKSNMKEATKAGSAAEALDEVEAAAGSSGNGSQAKRAPRLWCVVRIVDYRLQALAVPNEQGVDVTTEADWSELGPLTYISADRESVFQLARAHQGLLMSAEGLPTQMAMAGFKAAKNRVLGIA